MDAVDPLDRLISGKREFGEFGGVNASVEISTTFTVLEADTLPAIFNGEVGPEKGGCYVYGRAFNPTVRHLGRLLASLEGCEAAYPCSSGMAAISSTLMALCNSGDHIVASNTIYGGSHALLKTFLPAKAAIHTTFVDITDLDAVRSALRARPTKVVYTEVVSNPTLRVADLGALAELAHGSGAALVVDNTFTPFVVTPRRFGADVVIHSLTKFVSGASDIIAGAVCGSAAFVASLMDFHTGPCMLLGPTMDPKVASELALRLPHLGLRMQEHGRRAAVYAARLAALGAAVTYPGLPCHPQHDLMAAQANPGYGFGGLLGLDLGSPARANAFMERLQNRHGFGFMAVSLGYFDSLMSLSAASTSSELSADDMAVSGIGRGYVRLSVGITGSLEARWAQLEESFLFASKLGPQGAAPFRAVKLRRTPSGAAEQVISWPSLGSMEAVDADADAGAVPTAAATAATAGATATAGESDRRSDASNGGAVTGVGAGVNVGGIGVEGSGVDVVNRAEGAGGYGGSGDATVGCGGAAVAGTAASAESGNEDEGDAGTGPGSPSTEKAAAAADSAAGAAAAVVVVAAAASAAAAKSPFVSRTAPRDPSGSGANFGAAAAEPHHRASAGGEVGLDFPVHGSHDGPEPSATKPVHAPPVRKHGLGLGLDVPRVGPASDVQRPVKVRRTGSVEVHYVAAPRPNQ